MLPPWKIREVCRLLAEGRSYRQVQRASGVSYVTVVRIAHKRRNGQFHDSQTDDDSDKTAGPAVRCPRCGHRVYLPCRICEAREARLREKTRPTDREPPREDDALRLCLRPHHQERYEEVRRWRIQRGGRLRKEPDWPRRREK